MTESRADGIIILLGVLAGFCQDADFFHGKCTGGIRSSAQGEHFGGLHQRGLPMAVAAGNIAQMGALFCLEKPLILHFFNE